MAIWKCCTPEAETAIEHTWLWLGTALSTPVLALGLTGHTSRTTAEQVAFLAPYYSALILLMIMFDSYWDYRSKCMAPSEVFTD